MSGNFTPTNYEPAGMAPPAGTTVMRRAAPVWFLSPVSYPSRKMVLCSMTLLSSCRCSKFSPTSHRRCRALAALSINCCRFAST